MEDTPTLATGWPTAPGTTAPSGASAITADRSLLNQQFSALATSVASQGDDTLASLQAILAAIAAKPTAT